MKLKKMMKMLKEATDNHSSMYSDEELDYMSQQLKIIQEEVEKIEHKNYKGFGKK
jgi:hypothetical protein